MGEWVESGFYYPNGEPLMIEELRWFKKINKKENDKNESNGLSCYLFDERRLEAVRKDQKIIITADGKTTTARLFDGKSLIKSAEAKCNPKDKFDFETGAKIAFDRLVDREEKVKPKDLLKNGVFGKTADNDWFVVVGDSVIYKRGMFDIVEEFSEDLDDIVALIAAKSFNEAEYVLKNNSQQVIWRNPKWMK